VVDNGGKDNLVSKVLDSVELTQMPTRAEEPDATHLYADQSSDTEVPRTRAFIKVQDGCRNRCSYCVVTIARGDEKSRSVEEIVNEINELHSQGYREAVLTGVHLGGYGSDIGTDLFHLVESVLERCKIDRVRLSSLEPWDLPTHFHELWQHPKLMPHLHLPLQSGSDSVLRRMSRRCFTDEYRALVERLRDNISDLSVTTDLIVGFPGETAEEWSDTLQFAEALRFAHIHIFGFSPREGTRAAVLSGRIPGPVIKERSRELHRVAARSKEDYMRSYLGNKREVLWESGSKEGQSLRFSGYTDNYLRVTTTSTQDLSNRVTSTHLTDLDGVPTDKFIGEPV
jgi:threonylcarbamoyladenosine tRNA methylthiotransferase MtaB